MFAGLHLSRNTFNWLISRSHGCHWNRLFRGTSWVRRLRNDLVLRLVSSAPYDGSAPVWSITCFLYMCSTCVNADTYVTGQLPRLFVPLVMSQAEVDGFYYCCCLYFCLFELGFSFPRRVLSLGLHACRSNILPLSYIFSLWSSLIIIAQHTEHNKPSKILLNEYNASPMQSEHLWLVIHIGVVICSHLKMHAKKKGENFSFYPAFQRRLIFLKLYINCMPTFLNSQ